jgi:hypothetical protein
MTPTLFALCAALPFFAMHGWILRRTAVLDRPDMGLFWAVFVFKVAVVLTMGHYDLHRFIVFLQRFVTQPGLNPWDAGLSHPDSDFPYPPVLLYLHALPFWLFKPLLIGAPGFEPNGYGYVLIRIPFLVAELLFLRFGLLGATALRSRLARGVVLLSPVIVFHQCYSGQLDWIAVVPFFLAVQRWQLQQRFDLGVTALLTLSLMLKPFAVVFLPFWFLAAAPQHRLRALVTCCIAFALFKVSELPYALSDSYRHFVGAGASQLLLPSVGLPFPAFPALYALLLGVAARHAAQGASRSMSWAAVMVILAMMAGAQPSAGWAAWLVPFAAELRAAQGDRFKSMWRAWGGLFVVRWALVSHSPVLDSFDVFLKFHTTSSHRFGMGALYRAIAEQFGTAWAELSVQASAVALAVCSAALFAVQLASKSAAAPIPPPMHMVTTP